MVLSPGEYNASYFDGASQRLAHNAGYASYERRYRFDGLNSTGELWQDVARDWAARFNLSGKRVLELGCAKGFVVEDLRTLGVGAYGCDISSYAISCATEAVRPYLLQGDAREVLQRFPADEFDRIISRGFLECVDPSALPALIVEMNRVAHRQIHFIHTEINPEFYVQQSVDVWANYAWEQGTVIIAIEGAVERVI
jgi:2-polyprenyl-3-methyl-5-hydroxy-6-metoxy-1,4-benzoquinol methylase